ncbi:Non-catalytic module family DOC2, partial [Piromyces sp. E2]
AQGYSCCANNCSVVYVDGDGSWGVENGEWCGCGGGDKIHSTCSSSVILQGYQCCSSCSHVYYIDESGAWGVENGDWCG